MNIPSIGTRVKWKQPVEGVISAIKPHSFCVKFDGSEEWSFESEQISEFDVIGIAEPTEERAVVWDTEGDVWQLLEGRWRTPGVTSSFDWETITKVHGPMRMEP